MKKILITFLSIFQSIRRGWLLLTGKTEEDIHNQRIVSGKAWEEFCDTLKTAGAALVYPGAPQDPVQQAEGVRYLSRIQYISKYAGGMGAVREICELICAAHADHNTN